MSVACKRFTFGFQTCKPIMWKKIATMPIAQQKTSNVGVDVMPKAFVIGTCLDTNHYIEMLFAQCRNASTVFMLVTIVSCNKCISWNRERLN